MLKEEPIAPSELNVQVPPGFDSLMKKALAKRPDERFQTAQAFIAAPQAAATGGAQVDNDATLIGAGGDAERRSCPQSRSDARKAGTRRKAAAGSGQRAGGSVPPPAARKIAGSGAGHRRRIAAVGLGAGAWMLLGKGSGSAPADVATTPAAPHDHAAAKAAPANDKEMVITAVGYADPSDPRYASDPGLLKAELREDAKRSWSRRRCRCTCRSSRSPTTTNWCVPACCHAATNSSPPCCRRIRRRPARTAWPR